MPQSDELRSLAFRDYFRVVSLRLWLVVLVAAVCTGAAYFIAHRQVPLYQAGALLMYQPPTDVSNATGSSSIDTSTLNVQLQNVINAVDAPALTAQARAHLSARDAKVHYAVTAALFTSTNPGANVFPNQVKITAESESAAASARIANAYAQAVITLRQQTQQERYRAAQSVLQDQLKLFTTPASRLNADYVNLKQMLTNLQIAEAAATADFSVNVPATAPPSPASPRPLRSAALGFGVGIIAGIGLAFAVGKFDTRVRTYRSAVEILGLPAMGRIPAIERRTLRDGGLVTLTDPDGAASEALRMLRSNLEWASIDDNLRTVLVTSSLKGEGKTLTSCNLAVTLARMGKHVVIVDADLRDPRVHKVFNLPNAKGLTSVVRGTVALEDAFQRFEFSQNAAPRARKPIKLPMRAPKTADGDSGQDASEGEVFVLTSGPLPPDPGEVVASRKLAAALREISESNADYVLVDAPPLLSVGDAAALSSNADGLLMVANLEMVRKPTLEHVRELLDTLPCRKLGVVFVGQKIEHADYYRYKTNGRG